MFNPKDLNIIEVDNGNYNVNYNVSYNPDFDNGNYNVNYNVSYNPDFDWYYYPPDEKKPEIEECSVVAKNNYLNVIKKGMIGEVVVKDIVNKEPLFGVDWADFTGGHDCNGNGRKKHCLWMREEYLRLAEKSDYNEVPITPNCIFKINDLVVSEVNQYENQLMKGMEGIVRKIKPESTSFAVAVEWFGIVDGSDCEKSCKENNGLWMLYPEIKLKNDFKDSKFFFKKRRFFFDE